MVPFKLKYVLWFFQTIWRCIVDFVTNPIVCLKENLWKENWQDFMVGIALDNDDKLKEILEEINKKKNETNN